MISVDHFDLKILSALQDDGRLTNQQLADIAGLSASQCSRRRMRLEEDKVIAGYHADLASEALGFGVIAFPSFTSRWRRIHPTMPNGFVRWSTASTISRRPTR
jgi:DNA-binding Lrp family transcriptional regulator